MVLATSWSLLHPGFFRVHDYVHGARIGEMSRALAEGQFPVRWSPNFGYGYGMPLFEFYAPLPYYAGALLVFIGLNLMLTIKALWLLCSVVTAWGAYKLGSKLFGRAGGLLTAAALTLAPYRAVNLYVRGALSEAWGIMAMPWILLGIVLVVKGKHGGWLTLVVGLVTLFLSHNLTTMIFLPLSALFALGLLVFERLKRAEFFKHSLRLAGSYLLAIGLSAFYLFPAFVEKNYTKVSGVVGGGYFDYRLHFLYIRQFLNPRWAYGGSVWGPQDDISFFLGWGQWLGLGLMVVLLAWWGGRFLIKNKAKVKVFQLQQLWLIGLFGILFAVSMFMTLLKSKVIWDRVSLLAFIQFPWRWLSAGITFLSLLIGSLVLFIPKQWVRQTVSLVLVAVITLTSWMYFQPEFYLDNFDGLYYTDPPRIQSQMSGILNDYVPIQMPADLKPPTSLLTVANPTDYAYEILIDRGHEKLIKTTFKQPGTLEMAIADFPGWQLELDGQAVAKEVSEQGTLTITVPSGEHRVGVFLSQTPIRAIADGVSVISLVVLLYLVMSQQTRHNRNVI